MAACTTSAWANLTPPKCRPGWTSAVPPSRRSSSSLRRRRPRGTFTAAMKPPATMMANRPDYAELIKLPTPERIDKMKALHTQRMADMTAAMEQRGEATKAFYAVLTPEQQKVFDASITRRQGPDGRKGGHMGHMGVPTPKQ